MTVEASAASEGGFYFAPGLFPNPTVHRAARPSAALGLVVGRGGYLDRWRCGAV